MPMIRYRIRDIGEFPADIRPGHPSSRLKSVIGRNLAGWALHRWHSISAYVQRLSLREFMVVQNEDYSLELQLAPSPNFSAQDEDAILKLLSKNLPTEKSWER